MDLFTKISEGLDLDAISEQTEIELGETTFIFEKMPVMKSWRLLERIRTELVSQFNDSDVSLLAILKVNYSFIERTLMKQLFEHVRFRQEGMKGGAGSLVLARNTDMAFDATKGMQPEHVYEVLGRSFVVNFSSFLSKIGQSLGLNADLSEGQNTPLNQPS